MIELIDKICLKDSPEAKEFYYKLFELYRELHSKSGSKLAKLVQSGSFDTVSESRELELLEARNEIKKTLLMLRSIIDGDGPVETTENEEEVEPKISIENECQLETFYDTSSIIPVSKLDELKGQLIDGFTYMGNFYVSKTKAGVLEQFCKLLYDGKKRGTLRDFADNWEKAGGRKTLYLSKDSNKVDKAKVIGDGVYLNGDLNSDQIANLIMNLAKDLNLTDTDLYIHLRKNI